MPGSLSLIFDLAVSGHTNNYIMNVVARALFDRLIMKFAREIAQDTDDYALFELSEYLFLTENERVSMFREGIQPVDLSNIRYNAEDKKKSGVENENKFNVVYQNKYRIPLDQKILKDHGVFFSGALCDELLFKLRRCFNRTSVDKGSDTIINESINVPRKSVKGHLLLLYEPYVAGARVSEKAFNPDITEVK